MIGASGPPTWLHRPISPVKILRICSSVRVSTGFCSFTYSVTPSRATRISVPMVWNRSRSLRFSSSFISRDAMHTSVVPLISAAIPVPDPPPVTWMIWPGWLFMYSSAHRWTRITMVSEPLTVMPRAARAIGAMAAASAATTTTAVPMRIAFTMSSLPPMLELKGQQVAVGILLARADELVRDRPMVGHRDPRETVIEPVDPESPPLELVVSGLVVGIEPVVAGGELQLVAEVLNPHDIATLEVGGETLAIRHQEDRGRRRDRGPDVRRVGVASC